MHEDIGSVIKCSNALDNAQSAIYAIYIYIMVNLLVLYFNME